MPSTIDMKSLFEAGVHFGHRTEKWDPRMKPYIFGAQHGVHVIDLSHTVRQIEKASRFLKSVAASGGKVLFVGCKKQSQQTVQELAERSNSYHVTHRWLGGMLTNLHTIRKTVAHMHEIEEMEKNGRMQAMPKHESSALRRELAKLQRNLGGVRAMNKPPTALVIVDPVREEIAVQEAAKLKIPIVAINDTNSNPECVDYSIVGNDDAMRSIRLILDLLNEAIIEGNLESSKRRADEEKTEKAEKAKTSSESTEPAVTSASST